MKAILVWRSVLLGALAVLGAGQVCAVTRYVSPLGGNTMPHTNWASAATTIEAAVYAADAGDVILVSNGVYYPAGTIVLSNQNLTVQGLNGPDATIVDGSGAHALFDVVNGGLVTGLTITNGAEIIDDAGGGVMVEDGRIDNCVIVRCTAKYGAGLQVGSRGIASSCIIRGNSATHVGGGALVIGGGLIEDCLIVDNEVTGSGPLEELYFGGGGVLCFFGGLLEHCTVSNNASASSGGGICVYGTNFISRCVITANTAAESGGGSASSARTP